MTITLNFERCSWPEESLTVAAIMERRRWTFPQIIVKINGSVVAKEAWKEVRVTDGDEVEMFHLVAGG